MEELEELNARLVDDCNNAELEVVERDESAQIKTKKKIQVTIDTIVMMKKRKAELVATNDILMAPKRAALREEQKRND